MIAHCKVLIVCALFCLLCVLPTQQQPTHGLRHRRQLPGFNNFIDDPQQQQRRWNQRRQQQQRQRPGAELVFSSNNPNGAQAPSAAPTTTTPSPPPAVVYVNNRPITVTMAPFVERTTPTPQFVNCFSTCLTTPEYNPICASNREVYFNEQKFRCAQSCGADIQIVRRGSCEGLFPMMRG